MKRLRTAAALLMFSLGCATSACGPEPEIRTASLQVPGDRLDCQAFGTSTRPMLPAQHVVDFAELAKSVRAAPTMDAAVKVLVDEIDGRLLKSVRTREGVIVGYVIEVEGETWHCASDAQWIIDWQAGTARAG